MKRKLISILLVLALLTSLAPVSVFAEAEEAAATEEAEPTASPEPTAEPTQAPTPEPTQAPTPEPAAVPAEEPAPEAPAASAEEPASESVEAPAPAPEDNEETSEPAPEEPAEPAEEEEEGPAVAEETPDVEPAPEEPAEEPAPEADEEPAEAEKEPEASAEPETAEATEQAGEAEEVEEAKTESVSDPAVNAAADAEPDPNEEFTVRPVGETDRSADPGDDVTLAVEVTGSGEFTYRWREIRGIMESEVDAGNSTDTLALPNIRKSGKYICYVSDQYGNKKSVQFQVTVSNDFRVLAPVQAGPWDRVEIDAAPGNDVRLTVNAAAGSGDITYTWYRFSERDWEYTEVQAGNDPEYIVPSAGSEVYYCRATDQYGTPITVAFRFFVNNHLTAYAENTTKTSKNITVSVGGTAVLGVTAKADKGDLEYRWFIDTFDSSGNSTGDQPVPGAESARITTSEINMYTKYTCEVSDIYGNAKRVWFYIFVDNDFHAYIAGTNTTSKHLFVAEGASATLEVKATAASGGFIYQWYSEERDENGVKISSTKIPGATSNTFTTPAISGYRSRDAVYCCRVADECGNQVWIYFYIRNADIVIYANNEEITTDIWVDAGRFTRTLSLKTVDGAPISSPTWEIVNIWCAQDGAAAISVDSKNVLKANYVGDAKLIAHYGEFSQSVLFRVFFSDVRDSGAYYYDPVYWAAKNGVTTGTSPSTFAPGQSCTRGQIVTFLWRAYGSPEPSATACPFKDVKAGAYYYKAVLWAVENGITTGTSATTFEPNSPCTRGHIVTFLWRAAGEPAPTSSSNPFKDVEAGKFYYDAVLWAVENGITTGTSATTFAPTNKCTRGQCVTFLWRAVK